MKLTYSLRCSSFVRSREKIIKTKVGKAQSGNYNRDYGYELQSKSEDLQPKAPPTLGILDLSSLQQSPKSWNIIALMP